MKLLTTNADLSAQLARLVGSYPSIAFAVAWASCNTPIFRRLLDVRARITKGVIGTHFYQTHPDVLEAFMGSNAVRFRLQPTGVFHPKLYVFWSATQWEALVGSANLTSGALSTNSEVVVMLSGRSVTTEPLAVDMLTCIDGYWSEAEVATSSTVEAYRSIWERQQPALRRLGGQYGKAVPRKAPVASSVQSMRWSQFLGKVKEDPYHGYDQRCELLRTIAAAFAKHADFASMPRDVRNIIAGLPTDSDPRWGWFGSMKGAGRFQEAVKDNSIHLSRALALVPARGLVTRTQYDAFLAEYILAFPNGRHGIGTASRLLAMRRPDQFVCVDSKNQKALCHDFGIPTTAMNYERYWTEIVERILDAPWWNAPRPSTQEGSMVWDGRAAMLDAIFYRQ